MNQNGLDLIIVVKTAYKNYPVDILNESQIAWGEWIALQIETEDVKLQAVKFIDLKEKQFVSTYSTILPGPPRKTKHCGKITCPMIAYEYLQSAASINIHNHVHTVSGGFGDVWQTKKPIHCQFPGVMGFVFTSTYLAKCYFQKSSEKYASFKVKLANVMKKQNKASYKETANLWLIIFIFLHWTESV